jgi:hypothetical protein
MIFRIALLLLSLLCFPAWADSSLIPDLSLTSLSGKSHQLRAPEHQVLLVAKPGKKYRAQNAEWMQSLVKAFQEKKTPVWLVADLSSRPRFASKDKVKKKLNSEAKPGSKQFLLLDWDGELRKELKVDSQHHVYLLGPGGEILAYEVGVYTEEKLNKLVQAR